MNTKKLIGYAVGPIGSSLLGFITLPIITWFYSVEDVGRVSMLQVSTSFFILLFCLGLDQAYVREFHSTKQKAQLFKTTLLPGLLLSILFLIIILSYDSTIISLWLYDIPDKYLSIITIICFVVALVSRFLSLIIRMQERALAFSMSQLLPKILFLFFILFTVWLQFSRDTYNLITANALSLFFAFLIFSWNTRTDLITIFKYKIKKEQLRQVFAFGLPLVLGSLAVWGLNVMDKLFLRAMSNYTELGIYSVAMSIAAVAAILSGIFNTIWSPMVFKWESESSVDLKKIDNISEIILVVVYFLIVLSGLFSWIIPYLLPKQYSIIQFLITSCLLGPLFYTLSETTAVGIALTRKTKLSMLASVGAMLVNLLGNYLLVPKYGAIGATASTAFAFWCFFILRTEFSKLAWRKIPTLKSYMVSTVLMTFSIYSMFCLKENYLTFFLIWFLLLITGFFIFFNTIKEMFFKIRQGF
ncbi:oligosaccharide flippase family protein [Acinetobacter sp. 272263]|uniref:oligosaccharide flippase family protein n=1 Tax=Acinetobacter sp. 272263 TaxID=1310639 RepID=UPI00044BD757|nr:oligosaccharide flippase family protein [Acinetobacter sp. 272263]EXB86722.1 polysaccharide biosynthesis family protein [Acinetobacter sp. 272263]